MWYRTSYEQIHEAMCPLEERTMAKKFVRKEFYNGYMHCAPTGVCHVLDKAFKRHSFSLGGKLYLCPFGCDFASFEMLDCARHLADNHNNEELERWGYLRPLLALYSQ